MTDRKIWFITGAGRGMGVDLAKAALAAGDAVVAAGRSRDAVAEAVGEADDLLAVRLDVTSSEDAERAVRAAVDRFGRIDVVVNNAGTFYAGYFEELAPERIERQLATNLIGPMSVARAVLPVMREQRSGHIVSISSGAGLVGFEFCSPYAASKFGLEGWMDSLGPEVAPFGIHTTIVEPASFRTEVLTRKSATYAASSIQDYTDRTVEQLRWWEEQSGRQPFDPAKLAQALLVIASQESPPAPFYRRRRRDRYGRAEGRRPAGGDKRLRGPVHVANPRRGRRRRQLELDRHPRNCHVRRRGLSHRDTRAPPIDSDSFIGEPHG
jgi:NAD(P)-dependent dehydrogenase (short-subunit alcohol dehydrogenase family)